MTSRRYRGSDPCEEDSLAIGIVVVDSANRVEQTNQVAHAALEAGGPLVIRAGHLRGATTAATQWLASVSRHHGPLARSFGPLHVLASPIPKDPFDVFGHTEGWRTLRLTGAPIASVARRVFLRTRFGATPTEAAVGDLIAQGWTIPRIALHLQRSPLTIRTHAKRLFQKAGVHSQRALAVMMRTAVVHPR